MPDRVTHARYFDSLGTPMMPLCNAHEMTGEEPCQRLAQWEWELPDKTYLLCNFHAEPFEPLDRA